MDLSCLGRRYCPRSQAGVLKAIVCGKLVRDSKLSTGMAQDSSDASKVQLEMVDVAYSFLSFEMPP